MSNTCNNGLLLLQLNPVNNICAPGMGYWPDQDFDRIKKVRLDHVNLSFIVIGILSLDITILFIILLVRRIDFN